MRVDVEDFGEVLLETVGAVARPVAKTRQCEVPSAGCSRSDSAAANSPFTIASRTAPATFTESMSEAACLKLPCAGANFASAIGEMLVKRQSSFRVVGKPTSANRREAARAAP